MKSEFECQMMEFSKGKVFTTCLSDFCEIVLCALSLGQCEERYHELIGKYTKKEVQQVIPSIFGELVNEYRKEVTLLGGWCDPLGDVFDEWKGIKAKQHNGQFFTPPSIADLMTAIVEPNKAKKDKRYYDPTCGSGRTLLSVGRQDADHNNNGFFVGQDLDRLCTMMCAINFYYHGMNGAVIHSNTLTVVAYGGWYVDRIRVRRLTADEALKFIKTE